MNNGRRLLLTTAVTRYARNPEWDRPELADDVQRMAELFTEDFGYRHVPVLGLSPTADQLRDGLRDFCTAPDRRPDDYVVLYIAGHGEFLDDRESHKEHVLLASDADPRDLRHRAVKTAHLAEWILAGTAVRRLLLMLDTCYSGGGGGDAAREALLSLSDVAGGPAAGSEGGGVVLVTATRPNQMARPGAFTTAFARAARHLASGGYAQPQLRVDSILNVLSQDEATPEGQTATCHLLGLEGEHPAFLPNPRFQRELVDLDLMLQDQLRQAALRAEELRNRFVPATQWFTGRHRALTELARWLGHPGDDGRARVVTGNPGSGKTALLGLIAALSDAERRPTVPRRDLPDVIPDEGTIDAAVYAGNLSTSEVLAAIAAAAEVKADNVRDLLDALDGRERPLTVLVDALDEAIDPDGLIVSLLRPLLTHGKGRIRLLLGTRPHLLPMLRTPTVTLDLDDESYADPDSLRLYTRRVLIESRPGSPYRNADATAVEAVATAIAEAAQTSFLVARIAAQTHAALPTLQDPTDRAWRDGLPRLAGEAMRADLKLRLGKRELRRVRELLLPLAYAQGAGLPWEDIWPRLATALARDVTYTNEDLLWLRRTAGSYIVETRVGGESAYRLYHQALGEHLRDGRDRTDDQRDLSEALREHAVGVFGAAYGWQRAHRYIRTHLITHAAQGQQIDDLLTDPHFLLAAERPQLLAALPGARGLDAYSAAAAYRQAVHHLRGKPPEEHAAYLEAAAHCAGAHALAEALASSGLARPWSVRWASWRPAPPHRSLTGHTANVVSVAMGQAGGHPRVASGSSDGLVRVWDLATRSENVKFAGHRGQVCVALGEVEGRSVVVSGGYDRTVRIWDLATGQAVGEPLTGHDNYISAVALGELHGQPIAVSGSFDGTLRVWDLRNRQAVGEPLTGHDNYISAVALGELHGQPIAVSGSYDGTLRVWDLETGSTSTVLSGHTSYVSAVALGELDRRPVVVSGSDDRTLRVWDPTTGETVGEPFTGHTGRVESVAPAEFDGQSLVVSGSYDDTVRVWDLATGRPWGKPFGGHDGRVQSVAVGELDGWAVVASGGDDHTVRIWDLTAGLAAGKPFTGHTNRVSSVALGDLEGKPVVVSGSADHTVRVWDLATGQPMGMPLTGHRGWVIAVATGTFDGTPIAVSCGEDHTVRVWNLLTGQPTCEPLTDHSGYVSCVALGEWNGRPIVVAGAKRTVLFWDPRTGAPVSGPSIRHDGYVSAVAVGVAEGRCLVVSGSHDRSVRVWDLDTGQAVGEPFTGHDGLVESVALGELNGRTVVVSGSTDNTVRVWDLATGKALGDPLAGHAGRVRSVALGELDGAPVVVSGGLDDTIRVWDLATGKPVREPLAGNAGHVLSVAVGVLRGRPVVVSGNADHSIQVREISATPVMSPWPAGEPAEEVTGHTDTVSAVAASAVHDGSMAVSGGHDCTVRVWDLATGTPVGEPLTGHTDWIMSVAIGCPYDVPIAVSAGDRSVRIWNLATGEPLGEPLAGHTSYVSAVAVAEAGVGVPLVLSGSYDNTVRRWDPATGAAVGEPLTGHTDWITALTTSRLSDVPVAVSGSADGTARIWDLATGRPVGEPLAGHSGHVTAVTVTGPGRGLAVLTGGEDGNVLVWDVRHPADESVAGLHRRGPADPVVLLSRDAPVTALAFSQERKIVAVGTGSEVVLIRIGETYRQEIELESHVLGLAFGPGSMLVVATEQGLVTVSLDARKAIDRP